MLTEPEQLLLAAAVDGDLPPAEAKALARLLANKPEAARFLARLKADAARLRALPRRSAPAGVLANVMARVQPATPRTPARKPSWLPYAVAASVLFAVAAGSFAVFRGNTNTEQAQALRLPPPGSTLAPADREEYDPMIVARPGTAPEDAGMVKGTDESGAVAKLVPSDPPPVSVVQKPTTPEEKDVFTSPWVIEPRPIKRAEPALPILFSALDADKPETAAKLKAEFAKGQPVRLDLFTKNAPAALDHLQAAAKGAGASVFVDAGTAERLKKPDGLLFAFLLENLSADELAAVLAAAAKGVNAGSKPETVFGPAHLFAADGSVKDGDNKLTEGDLVKEMVGTDFAAPKASKPDGKPLSEGTLKEVVGSVKKSDKAGVVLTPRVNATKSAEVKQFLDKRGDRKPGGVPLLVIVRPTP